MYSTLNGIPYVPAVTTRTVVRLGPIIIPPGGILATPHTLGFAPPEIPAGVPAILKMLVGINLQSVLHAFNPIELVAVNATDVVLRNTDGANAATVELDAWLLPPWQALDGATGPGGVGPKNWAPSLVTSFPPAASNPVGPLGLSDQNPAAPPADPPIVVGYAPIVIGASGGDWLRYTDPPFVDNPALNNDSAGGAEDALNFGADFHSIQRYVGAIGAPDYDLFNLIGPFTFAPGPVTPMAHGLEIDNVPVVPDFAWLIPVGGAAPGAPMTAASYMIRLLVDAADVLIQNAGPAPFTAYLAVMRVHSSGRIV